ncbi:MAG: tetratricopeptide repeat protein [Desulfomonilaceae bacterium]
MNNFTYSGYILNPANRYFKMIVIAGAAVLSFQGMAPGSNDALDQFRQQRIMMSGQAFLEEGRRELARGAYLRSIRVLTEAISKGADPEALKLRGQAQNAVGAFDKAINDFSSYIAAKSSDPEGYVLRGDAYMSNLKHDKALPDYLRAIELDPPSVQAHSGRGIAYLTMEQYGLAIKDFRFLLERDSHNSDALVNLGLAYMLANMPVEAKKCFEEALETEQDPRWKLQLTGYIKNLPSVTDSARLADISEENEEPDMEPERTPRADSEKPPVELPKDSGIARVGPGVNKTALSGTWEGSYMGSRLKIQFQQSGRNVNGVLRVEGRAGIEDVYHFNGTYDRGNIVASHSDGHNFRGKLTDDRRLVGVVTTSKGTKFNLDLPEHR